ncbi:hypothetical protein DERP_005110 [Dermatophagoides pteronyssinus]|uniref:Protein Wnt n=1 Tax=Dermatophagoides pteronyssinus TaxID=6956 RepID=A0ABQ8JUB9_DERPT|nr:hypothetical protein DERP_005110 [Dermatophagoides pteronyssinus]
MTPTKLFGIAPRSVAYIVFNVDVRCTWNGSLKSSIRNARGANNGNVLLKKPRYDDYLRKKARERAILCICNRFVRFGNIGSIPSHCKFGTCVTVECGKNNLFTSTTLQLSGVNESILCRISSNVSGRVVHCRCRFGCRSSEWRACEKNDSQRKKVSSPSSTRKKKKKDNNGKNFLSHEFPDANGKNFLMG